MGGRSWLKHLCIDILIQKKKNKSGIHALKRDDGTITKNDADKAEELSNYFSSVFTIENVNNIPLINNRHDGN